MAQDLRRIDAGAARALAMLLLQRLGSPPEEARVVAHHLVRANLTGHDSHGIGVLPAYVAQVEQGLIVPGQQLRLVADADALLQFDGGRGFGQVMAERATRAAMARAARLGASVMGLRNAGHIGRVGGYAEIAAAEGMAFIAFVNVADIPCNQAPFGTSEGRLGTNPFCAAMPGEAGPALLLDFATTLIAFNKARIALEAGRPVPEGALLDAAGNPTTDPTELVVHKRGALRSFGLHKGSGMAVMCEAFGAVLTGGQRADEPEHGAVSNSMLAVLIDTGRFGSRAAHIRGLGAVADSIHEARPAPGVAEILLPGEPERRAEAERSAAGIPVPVTTWDRLLTLAREQGVAPAELSRLG
jgi:uncharacterized oxidoreductase